MKRFLLTLLTIAFITPVVQAEKIHEAVEKGDLALVKKLLNEKPSRLNLPQRTNGGNENTPLHLAIYVQRLDIIKFLLSKNANVNARNGTQNTPLHQAANIYTGGKIVASIVELLIQKKVDVNAKNEYGKTPLHLVNIALVATQLLAAGANPNLRDKQQHTPLINASDGSKTEVVRVLLNQKVSVNAAGDSGFTALWCACSSNHPPTVKLLLAHNANPNMLTTYGRSYLSPLHIAAINNHHEVIELLLAKKANPSIAGINGNTPLHLAATANGVFNLPSILNRFDKKSLDSLRNNNRKTVIALLKGCKKHAKENGRSLNTVLKRKNSDGNTPLQLAMRGKNFGAVNLMLPHIKDLTAIKLSNGESLIHWASRNGIHAVLTLLTQRKQTKNFVKKDREGKTPLELACAGNSTDHIDTVRALLKAKTPINTQNENGETPAHIAAWNGNTEILQVLLQQNKTLATTKDNSGLLPIHLAAWNGRTEVVNALLKAGCNINATNSNGSTTLHIAAWNGHTKLVAYLITAKANLHAKDNDGLTPLHKAAWNGHLEIVKTLIAAGANPHAKDNDGYTAFTKANEQGKNNVANYLKSVMKK